MNRTTSGTDNRSWWRLGRDGWRSVLASTAGQFKEDQVPNLAAVVTLRLVLALVPSLIAAVAISTFFITPADIEALIDQAQGFVPGDSRDFVRNTLERIVDQEATGTAAVLGVLAGLFAATGGAAALINALNRAYDVQDDRGFLGQRLTALAIVVALFVTLAGMIVVLVFGPTILGFLLPPAIADSPLRVLITLGRYLLAVVLLMLFFGFVFRTAPNRPEPPRRLLTPGAVFGVAGWLLLSYLFSLYVRIAGNYSAYGAAAGVFILLIWLNYSFVVLLMGAELDSEIEKHLAAAAPPEVGDPVAGDAEPDEVDPTMPRHPGLLGRPRPSGQTRAREPTARTRRPAPRPRLLGAAARTTGAALAVRLWTRIAR